MKKALFSFLLILLTLAVKAQINGEDLGDPNINGQIDTLKDHDPIFPGGKKGFEKFLKKNLKMPKTSVDAQGKVYITFLVQKNGGLINVKVARGINPAFDAEALRVINKSPKWVPAKRNGKPVAMQYTVPITFRILGQ
jgi:TonB family protein